MILRELRRLLVSPETLICLGVCVAIEGVMYGVVYSMAISGRMFIDPALYMQLASRALILSLFAMAVNVQAIQGSRDYYCGLVYPLLEAAGSRSRMVVAQIVTSLVRWLAVMTVVYVGIAALSFRFSGGSYVKIEDIDVTGAGMIVRYVASYLPCVAVVCFFVPAGYLCAQAKPGATALSVMLASATWIAFIVSGGVNAVLPAVTAAYSLGRWAEIIPSVLAGFVVGALGGFLLSVCSVLIFSRRDIVWKVNSK